MKNKKVEFLDTGCSLLNLACSQFGRGGGIPRGRIVNLVGDGSSGKCEKNSYILTEKGMIKIDDIIPNAKEGTTKLSQVVAGFEGVDEASIFYKEKVNKTIYIETKHGFEKEATECHPIMTWDSNNHSFVLKKMAEINVGDFVVIKKGMNFFPNKPFPFTNICKGKRKGNIGFTTPNEMSNELAKILGYIVADGNILQNFITISNSRDYIKSDIQLLLSKLGIKVNICKGGVNIARVEFREFISSLFSFPVKFTARFKFVPSCILQSTKENQAHFLQALIDCDGYFNKNSNLEYYTASFELAKQVQMMLLNFGIFTTLNKKWNDKYKRFYFTLRISFDDISLYEKEIGSLKYIFPKTLAKKSMFPVPNLLSKIWKDIENTRSQFGWFKNDKIKNNKRFPNYRNTYREGNCSHREIKKVINLFGGWMDLTFYKFLLNCHFSPVIKKTIKTKETFVYDFVIPKTHLFWSGGMISHNTLLSLEICAQAFYNIKNIKSSAFPKVKKIEIVYNNVEGVMDLPIEKMYGKKFVDGITWIQIGICEDFGRDYMKRLQNLKPGTFLLYVCDSLDATVPRAVFQKTMKSIKNDTEEGETFGAEKAKYFSNKFFDRLCGMMSGKDSTLICISQVRERIGMTFGEKYKRVGGKALDFYTHLVLWLSEIKKLKKTYSGHTRVYGVRIRGRVKRSKVSKPFREADFTVLFDYGIDNIGTTIDYVYGQTSKNIPWNNGKENIKMARNEFVEYLEQKPKALNRLFAKMEGIWNKIEDKTSVKRKVRFE